MTSCHQSADRNQKLTKADQEAQSEIEAYRKSLEDTFRNEVDQVRSRHAVQGPSQAVS